MGLGLENPLHALILLGALLLVFGAKRVPEMGRGLGRGPHEFRQSVAGHQAKARSRRDARAVNPNDARVVTPAETPVGRATRPVSHGDGTE
jgi:sec-independent protein translocase protein TatA